MCKVIQAFFVLLLGTVYATYAGPSLISKLYCSVLGDKDACPEHRQMVHHALEQLGVKEPANVPVKQMNGIGPAFARIPLSTFTAFGIWLDEGYLASCSEAEQLFHVYHEAAHYALNHHQKILAGCGIVFALFIVGLITVNGVLEHVNTLLRNSPAVGIEALAALGCYRYVLPQVVKRQEKQADLLAAQTLTAVGRRDVVAARIAYLKQAGDTDDGALWWYSNREQAECLEKLFA